MQRIAMMLQAHNQQLANMRHIVEQHFKEHSASLGTNSTGQVQRQNGM